MRVLVLAGSGEARELIKKLNARGDEVTASLAGVTRAPVDLGVETRIGGFGGAAGFADYLAQYKFDTVVDATHPFASRITQTVAKVCANVGMRHVVLQRPGWKPRKDDNWRAVNAISDLPEIIAPNSRVFSATGRQTLADYACLKDCKLFARVLDEPRQAFPFESGAFVVGRAPFSVEEEVALFQKLAVDWLVVKNSGGAASFSKLDAAAALNLPVAMLERPDLPRCHSVKTVDACLKWLDA